MTNRHTAHACAPSLHPETVVGTNRRTTHTCVTSLHPEIDVRTNCRTKRACAPPLHPETAVVVVMFIAIQRTQPRVFFEEERSVYRKEVFSSVKYKGHLKRAVVDSVAVLTKLSLMLPRKSFIFIIK